jgi:DNA-binding transcriptional regulator YdaS (Cro superfamily)
MDLKTYVDDLGRRRRLAAELGCSPLYLYQLAARWRDKRPSPEFAVRIEDATRLLGPETVPVQSMLPDLEWQRDAEGLVVGHLVRRPESKRVRQEKSAEAA